MELADQSVRCQLSYTAGALCQLIEQCRDLYFDWLRVGQVTVDCLEAGIVRLRGMLGHQISLPMRLGWANAKLGRNCIRIYVRSNEPEGH